jgi:hypothetical protein
MRPRFFNRGEGPLAIYSVVNHLSPQVRAGARHHLSQRDRRDGRRPNTLPCRHLRTASGGA